MVISVARHHESPFRPGAGHAPRGLPLRVLGTLLFGSLSAPVALAADVNTPQIINIQAPDARGISHNRHDSFDIRQPGMVLNNSSQAGQSQLAGQLAANPHLQGGPGATTIINEVTGLQRSSLQGALEVFGQRANVIIANPNGITADGLRTLNIGKLTLSTGVVGENAEDPLLRVTQGHIDITGKGVDTSGLQLFDLVAKTVALNGPIGQASEQHETDLRVTAGTSQQFDPQDSVPEAMGESVATQPAISGSVAGAMYGRNITLQTTDSGAGVRHQGAITGQGQVRVLASGDIEVETLTNQAVRRDNMRQFLDASRNQQTHVRSTAGSVSIGSTKAARRTQIDAAGDVRLKTIDRSGLVQIHTSATADIGKIDNSQGLSIDASNIKIGEVGASVGVGTFWASQGVSFAQEDVRFQEALSLKGAQISFQNMAARAIDIRTGKLVLTSRQRIEAERISLSGSDLTVQKGATLNANLDLAFSRLENRGTLQGQHIRLAVSEVIDNHHEILASQAMELGTSPLSRRDIASATRVNNYGKMLSGHTISGTLAALHNHAGAQLSSTQEPDRHGFGGIDLTAGELLNQGDIKSGRVQIRSTQGSNHGKISSATDLSLGGWTPNAAFLNTGTLEAKNALQINANLDNRRSIQADSLSVIGPGLHTNSGSIQGQDLTFSGSRIDNQGDLAGGRRIVLAAASVSNAGEIKAEEILWTDGKEFVNQSKGKLIGGELQLQAAFQQNDAMLTNHGQIKIDGLNGSQVALTNRGELDARQLTLTQAAHMTNSGTIVTDQGRLQVQGEWINHGSITGTRLELGGKQVENTGAIKAANQLVLSAAGELLNAGTGVLTGGQVSLQARSDDDDYYRQGGSNPPDSRSSLRNLGQINGDTIRLHGSGLENSGSIRAGQEFAAYLDRFLLNTGSIHTQSMEAQINARRDARGLMINEGKLTAGDNIQLSFVNGDLLNGSSASIEAGRNLTIQGSHGYGLNGLNIVLNEAGASMKAGHNMRIQADDLIANLGGQLIAGQKRDLQARVVIDRPGPLGGRATSGATVEQRLAAGKEQAQEEARRQEQAREAARRQAEEEETRRQYLAREERRRQEQERWQAEEEETQRQHLMTLKERRRQEQERWQAEQAEQEEARRQYLAFEEARQQEEAREEARRQAEQEEARRQYLAFEEERRQEEAREQARLQAEQEEARRQYLAFEKSRREEQERQQAEDEAAQRQYLAQEESRRQQRAEREQVAWNDYIQKGKQSHEAAIAKMKSGETYLYEGAYDAGWSFNGRTRTMYFLDGSVLEQLLPEDVYRQLRGQDNLARSVERDQLNRLWRKRSVW